jgi:hypothetical protein
VGKRGFGMNGGADATDKTPNPAFLSIFLISFLDL